VPTPRRDRCGSGSAPRARGHPSPAAPARRSRLHRPSPSWSRRGSRARGESPNGPELTTFAAQYRDPSTAPTLTVVGAPDRAPYCPSTSPTSRLGSCRSTWPLAREQPSRRSS
jgi:hypothetical protein